MAKDPIDFGAGDSNLYGYVLGDPVGFVDNNGLSPEDVIKIKKELSIYIIDLIKSNLRRPGKGTVNGWLNNLSSWSSENSYLGCGDQASFLKNRLEGLEYNDHWIFKKNLVMNFSHLLHFNVMAISNNSTDPILYIDSWDNSFKEVKK
jgi:hypothetical protein